MTFKQILEKVDFENLVEPIRAIDSEIKGSMYKFRQTFDLLMRTEPLEDDGVVMEVAMEDYDDGNPP